MTADTSISRLFRFDNGAQTFAVNTGGPDTFLGVSVLNGEVLVAEYNDNAIQRFSPDGTYLGMFATTASPTFLESDSNGNVYTNPSSLGPPVATRFNSSGVVTQTFSHPTMNQNAGMDADATGNVYVADIAAGGSGAATTLFKFAPDGTFINSTFLGSMIARDVAIDEASNRLFIIDAGSTTGIKIFDISGAAPVAAGSIATPADATMEGIHFAAKSGNILATDFGFGIPLNHPRGFEFSPGGTLLWTYVPAPAEFAFDITTFVIPEPASLNLLFAGMLALASISRRTT